MSFASMRLGAAIITILVLVGTIFMYGRMTMRNEMLAAARKQQLESLAKEKEQNETTYAVAMSYTNELDRLHTQLGRLQKRAGSAVPAAPGSAKGIDGTFQEPSGACEGTEFRQNALEDVLKLNAWQEFARQQQLPLR